MSAALVSGLVFPGAGYWVVKRPLRAVVGVAVAGGCLLFVTMSLMQPINSLLEKAMMGEMPLDVVSVTAQVNATLAGSEATSRGAATYFFLVSWLFSIVDGYRIGRAQDQGANNTSL